MTNDFVIVATADYGGSDDDGAAAAEGGDGASRRRSVRLLGAAFVFPEKFNGRGALRFETPLPARVFGLPDVLKQIAALPVFKQQGCYGMPPTFSQVRGVTSSVAVHVRICVCVCPYVCSARVSLCASCDKRTRAPHPSPGAARKDEARQVVHARHAHRHA